MVKLSWTSQAIKDIDNIATFIANDSLKYAAIQVSRFFEKAKELEKNPEIGRIVPEYNNKSVRELLLGNYRIIYKIISEQRIDILTIYHSKRILDKKLI